MCIRNSLLRAICLIEGVGSELGMDAFVDTLMRVQYDKPIFYRKPLP